jgi:hypothetical protein
VSFFRIPSPRGGAERAKKGRTNPKLECFLSHTTCLFLPFKKFTKITKMSFKFGQITKMSLLGWQEYKVGQIYKFVIGHFLFWAFGGFFILRF